MTSLSQFPLLIHPTRKVQNSRLEGGVEENGRNIGTAKLIRER
jgi:hypothetical protein